MKRTVSLFLGVLAVALPMSAQQKPATMSAPPEPPRMSAEGKKFIEGWSGTWVAKDVEYRMGGETMRGTSKLACEMVSAGWAALCRGTFTMGDAPPSQGTFLMAFDIATGQAHMFEVQSTGEVHDHAGTWQDSRSVLLTRTGKVLGGADETDSCTASWPRPDQLRLECNGVQGGNTVWRFTSIADRQH